MGTTALNLSDWIIIILVSATILGISEIIKLMIRSEFKEQNRLKGKGGPVYKIE